MILNILALASQLLLMGWLLKVLGLHRALWVLPSLIALGAAGVAFGGGVVAALVLKGADGIVFVADSQQQMLKANVESFKNLEDNLRGHGLELSQMPHVIQFNKRDLKNTLTVDELNSDLNASGRYPSFEASAINGDGVFETLKEITKLTLKKLRKRMASSQPGGVSPTAEPVRPSMSPQRPESISAASLARAAANAPCAISAVSVWRTSALS